MVFDQRTNDAVQLTVMTCWMLWKNRNDLVWNQKSMDVSEVLVSAISVLNQWQYVQDKSFDNTLSFLTQGEGRDKWQAPEVDRVKVNVDAALFDSPARYSFALVVRDHSGKLLEAVSKCCQGTINPALAEAIGVREALSWVKKQKKIDVVVETDCLLLVQWVRSSYDALSYLGRVVNECRALLAGLQSQNVMLRFIKRSVNSVAHYLARYSSLIADRRWVMDDVHADFYNVLCNDLR